MQIVSSIKIYNIITDMINKENHVMDLKKLSSSN